MPLLEGKRSRPASVAGFGVIVLVSCLCSSGTVSAAEADGVIDFDIGALPAGTIVSTIDANASGTPVGPILVNGILPSDPSTNRAIIFDSDNPTGEDFDLGSPNETFGGPGQGPGGEMGAPFENNVFLHNILIIAEDLVDDDNDGLVDDPDDAFEDGMIFEIDFSTITYPFVPVDVTVKSVTTIDGETFENAGEVRLYDAGNNLLGTFPIADVGCNGVGVHLVGPPGVGVSGVDRMEVEVNGSTGLDDIEISLIGPPDPVTDLECTLLDVCSCDVDVTWNNGEADYESIFVRLNGATVETLPGNATMTTVTLPGPGVHEICIVPLRLGAEGDAACCNVECPDIPALPPNDVSCIPDEFDCSVTVTWGNRSEYAFLEVVLDGNVIETLGGTVESTTIPGQLTGMHTVVIQGETICGEAFASSPCNFDCMITPPLPVLNLDCDVDPCDSCAVTMTWENQETTYDEISITQNGTEIAVLPGDATSHAFNLPGPGNYDLCVIPRRFGVDGPAECCNVVCDETDPVSPADLMCEVNQQTCVVTVTWANPSTYQEIRVLLNGAVVATLAGEATMAQVTLTLPGINEICLEGETICNEAFPTVCCDVVCDQLEPPPVQDLDCQLVDPCACIVDVTWTNADAYDELQVLLDGGLLATLPGDATSTSVTLPDNDLHQICIVPVVNLVEGDAACCDIDCPVIPALPPTDLDCSVVGAPNCDANLVWTNNSEYAEIVISVNGNVVATLPGDSQSATVPLPGPGMHEICLNGTTICGDAFEEVCCTVICAVPFMRGECNDDDRGLDLADAIFIINFLFQGGPAPNCLAACDLNNDGNFDLGDAVFIFNYLFQGGPPPPPPWMECGIDPEADCEMYLSTCP